MVSFRNLSLGILFISFFHSLYSQQHDNYLLTYSPIEKGVIAVTANLTLEDSVLYMSQNSSKWRNFPDYVKELRVTDNSEQLVNTQFQDSAKWVLRNVRAGDRVKVKYELHVDHEEREWPGGIDGVAYKRDYGIMTSGRALFVMNGRNKKKIKVGVELPEGSKISTPWREKDGEENYFEITNLEDLQESFLFAGTHDEILMNRESFTLKFVLGGKTLSQQKQKLVNTANQLLDYYIKLMGGIPEPASGTSLDQCLVIITENDKTDGEVIGNHISMFMDADGEPQAQMIGWFIFAHEFFHFWNGKSLRFEGTRSDWFKEGVSNYYTLKGLNQVGFIDEAGYKTMLNNLFFQRYINDPGLGEKSPVFSADGFSKDNHWGLIYGGGLFAGIASDMMIRHNSSNEKSLDDLMRYLFKEYAGTDQLIDNSTLKKHIMDLGFKEFDDFFDTYLSGTKTIHLDPYLKYAGAEVIQEGENLSINVREERSELQAEIWEGFLGSLE
ncbi:hypothetical protein ML462_12575 [Gramella lutea]|uniref:Uncharacterized protein n=1 Tax=Christiangramia lutea TaxID=1607951 RepID=A0A9X2AB86_9FLAO|nr:hypothetical protein [Christiangramia lutea]MCH4824006.1 hypothetical protein [Christiangramia lutea]